NRQDERLLSELRDVLQDRPQVGQLPAFRTRHGSTTKLANCQRSASLTAGAPNLANRRDRLSSGGQLARTDGHGPRYGAAISRISRWGRSSGTRMPSDGWPIM